ncbi:lysine methyltransferase [Nitzschia inconspicua]|uniref:Lysine methyltransferase n=1 Tax=Nitzschia inconspicua TaxID=303405 RepID=A0A9K3PVZ7_9STRA|nr:lysine methyltransferase [Nitzschia inconspicua]
MRGLGFSFRNCIRRESEKHLAVTAAAFPQSSKSPIGQHRTTTSGSPSHLPQPSHGVYRNSFENTRAGGKPRVKTSSTRPENVFLSTPSQQPPLQSEPILLLEGDQYHFSEQGGIARSFYHLVDDLIDTSGPSIAIEEHYDLDNCLKSYIIRKTTNNNACDKNEVNLGKPLERSPLLLQEIPDRWYCSNEKTSATSPGTGSRTWDSSLAMAMYFGKHPELLTGRCIEVGSGVGSGGILSGLLQTISTSSSLQSLTLTDCQDQVIDQCKENVVKIFGDAPSLVCVNKLNWHDFLMADNANAMAHAGLYDTILACDCAYIYPDIIALAKTLKTLLRNNVESRCYVFGPSNRGGFHELIKLLREDASYHVNIQELHLVRYRLEASIQDDFIGERRLWQKDFLHTSSDLGRRQHRSKVCSKTESAVLLATLSFRSIHSAKKPRSISDID